MIHLEGHLSLHISKTAINSIIFKCTKYCNLCILYSCTLHKHSTQKTPHSVLVLAELGAFSSHCGRLKEGLGHAEQCPLITAGAVFEQYDLSWHAGGQMVAPGSAGV